MKKILSFMSLTLLVAGCADRTMPVADLPEIDTSNPLLAEWETPYATPPFERIELKDYEPAFDAAIAVQRAEIEAIVKNPAKPSFHNTIVALERSGELLSRIEGLFYNLLEADSNDEMQRIALDVQPKLTALSNDIALDPALFARVKAVYENPGWFLSKEDKRLLEKTYKSFARNGAALPADKQELYRQYTTELGEMTLKFGQNSLAATNAFTLNITDPGRVEELPDFVKEGLAADAKARGERGWLWVCIVLLSSPLLGGLLYLLARRDDRRPCRFCGWMVDKDARFCSRCGKEYPVCDPGSGYQEDLPAIDQPARRRNRRFLAAVLVSVVLMIVSLVGMIVSAVMGTDLDTGIEWNTGWVMMNVENTWDNVWTFRYNVASEDYHTSSRLEVEDPQTQQLRVDLQFEQGESMRMTITQEREDGQEIEQEYFVESDSAPQYFPLDDFEAGKIRVRFYNNGVSDVDARVTVE